MWKDARPADLARPILQMGGMDPRSGKKDPRVDEVFWTEYARRKSSPGEWSEVLERLATTERDKLDGLGYDVLKKHATGLLRRGEALPGFLSTFVADVLDGTFERPPKKREPDKPKKRGPDKSSNFYRDFLIWWTVEVVAQEFGLPRYSNDDPDEKPSAAAAVAEVMGMSELTVKDIYKREQKSRKLSSLHGDETQG